MNCDKSCQHKFFPYTCYETRFIQANGNLQHVVMLIAHGINSYYHLGEFNFGVNFPFSSSSLIEDTCRIVLSFSYLYITKCHNNWQLNYSHAISHNAMHFSLYFQKIHNNMLLLRIEIKKYETVWILDISKKRKL